MCFPQVFEQSLLFVYFFQKNHFKYSRLLLQASPGADGGRGRRRGQQGSLARNQVLYCEIISPH